MPISSAISGVYLPPSSSPRSPGLAHSPESREGSPSRNGDMRRNLRDTFGRSWPQWQSTKSNEQLNLTIRMDQIYREIGDVEGASAAVESVEQSMGKIIEAYNRSVLETNKQVCDWVEDSIVEAIFGSNAIEKAGSDYNTTLDICRKIFRGHTVDDTISERSPEYEQALNDLYEAKRIREGEVPYKLVIRSRREVIQHAKAMQFMILAITEKNQLMTEILILKTHAILCAGISNDDGTEPEEYAGQYRTDDVAVQHKNAKRPFRFIRPQAVPTFMQNMCQRYQEVVDEIERTNIVDPYALAARFSHVFVNIHPFADGNGRMSRIMLNAILLKYGGVCVPIGEEGEQSRQDYLDIMSKGCHNFLDDSFEDFHKEGHGELASLVLKKASNRLETFVNGMWQR